MFERSRVDNRIEPVAVPVELDLVDGSEMKGKLSVPQSQTPLDVLNGAGGFIEFTPYGGEPRFIAKSTIVGVQLVGAPRAPHLRPRGGLQDDFDPHAILGVAAEAPFDEIRQAFVQLSKIYHPDRFSTAVLPAEVADYIQAMARRINAAYASLEACNRTVRQAKAGQAPAVYTSHART